MARRRDGGEEFVRLFGCLLLPPGGGVVEEGPRELRVTYPFDHRPIWRLHHVLSQIRIAQSARGVAAS